MVEINQKSSEYTQKPPTVGKLAASPKWLKDNLFKNWKSTLLTLLTGAFAIYILTGALSFVVSTDWNVVTDNLKMLMVGQFPTEEVWRIWTAVVFASALLGLSWGIWKGVLRDVAFTIGTILFIFGAVPYTESSSKIFLFASVALIFLFYFVGNKVPALKVPTLILWLLYVPISLGIINGFGMLDPVSTHLWGGFMLTIALAVVAIICSFPLGLLLAVGRRSKLPAIKFGCIIYIELIRGVPLIMVIFIGQLLLPMFLGGEIELDNVIRAMIAFTLFSAAYLSENIRGGLQSIPRGQFEAAQALGLSNFKYMIFVILPQALKAVIPAMVGQFISIFKDTSLVAVIGLADLLGIARRVSANPEYLGRYMELYVFVAFFFFVFCYLMSHVSRSIEKSLGVGTR